jgi:imidazoleglycerol phosphate dehydratase HisB
MKKIELNRSTKETEIVVKLTIDGTGNGTIKTGIPFFDHMLHAMAKHGGFDLTCTVKGDLNVDCHHTVEDTGIVLGDAIKQAIGDGKGIRRFAHAIIPMDESIAQVALDCGGRGYLVYDLTGHRSAASRATSSSTSSTHSAQRPGSPPTSRSPGETTTTSARRSSRRSGSRWRRRLLQAERKACRARRENSKSLIFEKKELI